MNDLRRPGSRPADCDDSGTSFISSEEWSRSASTVTSSGELSSVTSISSGEIPVEVLPTVMEKDRASKFDGAEVAVAAVVVAVEKSEDHRELAPPSLESDVPSNVQEYSRSAGGGCSLSSGGFSTASRGDGEIAAAMIPTVVVTDCNCRSKDSEEAPASSDSVDRRRSEILTPVIEGASTISSVISFPFGGECSGSTAGNRSSSSGDLSAADSISSEIPVVVERERCVGRQERVTWGYTSVIGRRKEMEDAVAVVPGFMSSTCGHVGGCMAPGSRTSTDVSPVHFFGVYDGHGGSQVAKFCAEKMHELIAEEWDRETIDKYEWQKKWEAAFSSGFVRADDQIHEVDKASEMVGSTAVVAVVSGCQIILSNCGDSRAVLCRGGQTVPLTVDQKPDREDELLRIEREGGKVINWNGARVLGVLAMSRAIGDRYMRPYIIPVPEITFMTRAENDECLILASDGLWDVMSNDEVGEVARLLLRRRRRSILPGEVPPAQIVADNLTQIAMGKNSSDNISIVVVDLKSKRRHQPR